MPLYLEVFSPRRSEWMRLESSTVRPGEGYKTFVNRVNKETSVYLAGCNTNDTFAMIVRVLPAGEISEDREYIEYPGHHIEKTRLTRESGQDTKPFRGKLERSKKRAKIYRFRFV